MSARVTKAWYAVMMVTFVLSLVSAGYQILRPLAVYAWDPQTCFEAYSCEFDWDPSVVAGGGEASCTYDGILQCCYWACEQNHADCSDACLAGYDQCCAENDCGDPTVAEACSNVVIACESVCWTEFNDCQYGWNSCEFTALASFVGSLQQEYIGACDWTTQPVPFGSASQDSYCQP